MGGLSSLGLGFIIGGAIVVAALIAGCIIWEVFVSERCGVCWNGKAKKSSGDDTNTRNGRAGGESRYANGMELRAVGQGGRRVEDEATYSTIDYDQDRESVRVGGYEYSTVQVRTPRTTATIGDDQYDTLEGNTGTLEQPPNEGYSQLGEVRRDIRNVYDSLPRGEEGVATASARPQSLPLQPMIVDDSSNDWIVTPLGAISPNPSQNSTNTSYLDDNSIILIRPSPEEPISKSATPVDVNSDLTTYSLAGAGSNDLAHTSVRDDYNTAEQFKRIKDDSGNYSSSDSYVHIEKRNGKEAVVFAGKDKNDAKKDSDDKNRSGGASPGVDFHLSNGETRLHGESEISNEDYVILYENGTRKHNAIPVKKTTRHNNDDDDDDIIMVESLDFDGEEPAVAMYYERNY